MLRQSGIAGDAIAAVGLSGQMHGAVLLDAAGDVIRPAIIWCDQRTDERVRAGSNEQIGPRGCSSSPAIPR